MANTPISPKVTAGANWSAYATLLLTLLNTITPDSLAFLGKFSPLAYGIVIGGSYALGAWRKADPLREAGLAAQAAAPITVPDPAPATTFPAAAVAAALAAEPVAPVEVTPVFTPPVA